MSSRTLSNTTALRQLEYISNSTSTELSEELFAGYIGKSPPSRSVVPLLLVDMLALGGCSCTVPLLLVDTFPQNRDDPRRWRSVDKEVEEEIKLRNHAQANVREGR
jgi:hypothetical protein